MSVTDSIKVVTPNSFLRLCKVVLETQRILAMAAQQNPGPIRSYSNKSSEILSLRRPTRPDLTTQLWQLKVVLPSLHAIRESEIR